MDKQDLYTLCTLIPPMDDYRGYNMYLCGKRDGFNECVQMLKENLENVKEEECPKVCVNLQTDVR